MSDFRFEQALRQLALGERLTMRGNDLADHLRTHETVDVFAPKFAAPFDCCVCYHWTTNDIEFMKLDHGAPEIGKMYKM